jgi:predicted dehydrogenase
MDNVMNSATSIIKVIRFIKIYGLARTLTKVLGRLRPKFKLWLILRFPLYSSNGKKVVIIGCGHHAYSSIAYFLTKSTNCNIISVIDIDQQASNSLAYAYNSTGGNSQMVGEDDTIPDLAFICSNHASHTQYAVEYLNKGCDVFIEKPISINMEQLELLDRTVKDTGSKIFVGYNRPHSPAIRIIKNYSHNTHLPFTLSCFITGHYIPADHWYRDPNEGTRIVSNLGHWLDLSVNFLFTTEDIPSYLDIAISYSNQDTPSDNIVVTMVSPRNDLINITFTSRSEPFEGVNESINFQQSDLIAKIDDFRTTNIWKGTRYRKFRHWPKNNGHKATVLQPFIQSSFRHWEEVKVSTRLMLHIENMVLSHKSRKRFILNYETDSTKHS